ncbi:MAG: HAMP domain-containing histidine kinase [Clostridia bacterium]|nr:HAMP domain-containing histidine kinase [Clostridia bacterium]
MPFAVTASCADSAYGLRRSLLFFAFLTGGAALLGIILFASDAFGRDRRTYRALRRAAEEYSRGNFSVRTPVRGKGDAAGLAEEFNRMAESLGSLERMRSDFISAVSHDMRTPMTTVSGFIDCILGNVIPPEQRENYLKLIKSEIMRLSRLVSRLLDISRLESKDRTFTDERFDLCELSKTVLFSFEQQIDEKELEVSFETDSDRMYINADKDAVHQVLYNLCDNAVKFSVKGGELRIRIVFRDGKVVYSVYNEGRGIREDDLPFIFDRFFKGDETRGEDKTGYGLGLYICKTIADAEGAELTCESAEGQYCRFILAFPADRPANGETIDEQRRDNGKKR